jgi:hypothetical protein
MSDQPENGIFLEITKEGKVRERPESRIQSTSHEAQMIFEKIVPQVEDFMEFLIHKHREDFKPIESE